MNLSVDMNTVPFVRPFVEIQPQQQRCQKSREEQSLSSLRKDSNTPITPEQVQQQAARRLWWKKSIVRRSFANIEKEVHNLISSSPYLQKQYLYGANDVQQQNNHFIQRGIARFHRNEIITGPILGKGGFSQVMEIVAFQLMPEVSQQCTIEEQALRQHYISSVFDTEAGKHRYCIKHLQEIIVRGCSGKSSSSSSSKKNEEFQLAASDLYIESVTLSILQHENIVSIRGLPIHGLQSWKSGLHDSYFIIMDQLSSTLDKKIEEWKTSCTSSSNNSTTILQEKAQCAYQLALALQYIHSNRLLYRDLKPQNIGFSLQDPSKIQLFDFGLCRELPSTPNKYDTQDSSVTVDDVYEMSGVGTRRYMAPEIVTIGQYNQKADVYSWSMVFYELLTCVKPYVTYSTQDHTTHVCLNHVRPTIPLTFPYWIHSILQHAWNGNISARSSIYEVSQQLQAALAKYSSSNEIGNNDIALYERTKFNDELYITNHDSLISKESLLPNSPTGVNAFPTFTHNKNDPRAATFQATSYSNIDDESESTQSFHEIHNRSADRNRRENYGSITGGNDIRFMQHHDSMVDLTDLDSKPQSIPLTSTSSTALIGSCKISPPPAPKRPPTTYVQVPDDLVRNFELSLSDDDDDFDDNVYASKKYAGLR